MILVTGASGFIGQYLVHVLVAEGHEVRALVRSDEGAARVHKAATAAGGKVEEARGDLGDNQSLKAAAAGCELVYHLAGSYRGSAKEMQTVHVAGTARLLRSIDPESRMVFVSSTSVYGWDQDWPADHATPPRPVSAYGKAKLGAEQLVRARTTGSSVVVRPTITYGIGDDHGMLARAYRLLRKRVRRFPGTGENRIHLLHVDDLVAGLVRAGLRGPNAAAGLRGPNAAAGLRGPNAAAGLRGPNAATGLDGAGRRDEGVFLLCGPEPTPTRELFGLLAEGAGLPPPSFGLPAGLLRPLASALDSAWSTAGREGEAPLSRHSVDVLTQDRAYSSERALRELGWRPLVDAREGIPAVGAWLAGRPRTAASPDPSPARPSAAAVAAGNATAGGADELGFDWRGYVDDPDEGLGTVYERFALRDVLQAAVDRTGARSVLHAPLFGMMGFPGLDAVFLAQAGVRVGLLDFSRERLEAVEAQWQELGLQPETHLVASADPKTWPDQLECSYDLVFSFAALWWFDDPWAVVEAQSRWAGSGVLTCVPNKNVFLRVRARLWHQGLFDRLNEEALDRGELVAAGQRAGLQPVDTGLFDIPPFPDTSVPLAKVVRAMLGRKNGGDGGQEGDDEGDGAWRWSILPYLKGEQPDLEERVEKLAAWERHLPHRIAPGLAHHRYTLFVPAGS